MTKLNSGTLEVPGAVLHYDIRNGDSGTGPALLIIASPMGAEGFAVLAACADIRETYQRSGLGPAMAKFIALVSYQGPVPPGYLDQPAPDPAAFGLPAQDDGSRDDPLVGQNMPSCARYLHDFEALGAAPVRIVIGVGQDSARAVAGRAAVAVARRLGTSAITFPGGHDGFLGGEYGRTGKPEDFAATLREVLSQA